MTCVSSRSDVNQPSTHKNQNTVRVTLEVLSASTFESRAQGNALPRPVKRRCELSGTDVHSSIKHACLDKETVPGELRPGDIMPPIGGHDADSAGICSGGSATDPSLSCSMCIGGKLPPIKARTRLCNYRSCCHQNTKPELNGSVPVEC